MDAGGGGGEHSQVAGTRRNEETGAVAGSEEDEGGQVSTDRGLIPTGVAESAAIAWLDGMRIVRHDERGIAYPLPPPETVTGGAAPQCARTMHTRYDPCRTGPHARVLAGRVASSTAGWVEPPSGQELYHALHARTPTSRQKALVSMWVKEATDAELIEGWVEKAYTPRVLVAAMHRCGCTRDWPRNAYLARLAT